MKLSAIQDLITAATDIADKCERQYVNADYDFQNNGRDIAADAAKLFVAFQGNRRDAAFVALDSLILARDIFRMLGYLEED